jgi:hypothetical protein
LNKYLSFNQGLVLFAFDHPTDDFKLSVNGHEKNVKNLATLAFAAAGEDKRLNSWEEKQMQPQILVFAKSNPVAHVVG